MKQKQWLQRLVWLLHEPGRHVFSFIYDDYKQNPWRWNSLVANHWQEKLDDSVKFVANIAYALMLPERKVDNNKLVDQIAAQNEWKLLIWVFLLVELITH